MHEFSIVESLVNGLLQQQAKGGAPVAEVHLRRGSAFSEDALRQAFEMLTANTPLEQAALQVESVNLEFKCACGHEQVVNSDDLTGHMFICPGCGAIKEIDEAHDLELVKVVAR